MADTANREDQMIERIRRRLPKPARGLLKIGIGDDAAVLQPSAGTELILTCDQFVEGVHFVGDIHPPEVVGRKALARATSDIAAMGARPRLFLLSLTLPADRAGRWLDRMVSGMAQAARQFRLALAGGDTARPAPGGKTAMSITVLGEAKEGQAVLRSGARPGDAIFVTGRLGAAQLGLELVLHRMHRQKRWARLLLPHFSPKIQIDAGQWLAQKRLASAMMDLSDGLSTDLDRLCRASGVGARVYRDKLPYIAIPLALRKDLDPLALALHGGEDYALLFTVPKRHIPRIPRTLYGSRITRIGEIARGRGVWLVGVDGIAAPLVRRGWDHFASSE